MNIAWFTPFRKSSAIGRFSRLVTDRLAQDVRVDLWLAEPDGVELHETSLRVVSYSQLSNIDHYLREYDIAVYNLGDQAANHASIYDISQRFSGVVILHDYVMHHFFASYYHKRGEFGKFVEILRQRYGAAINKTPDGWDGPILRLRDTDQVIDYPLFEEAVIGSRGVVTHSTFVRDAVARAAGAPVTRISLAYDAVPSSSVLSRGQLGIREDRVLVVTVGHANENKRIHMVLQALAENRTLAASITYVVIGGCEGPFASVLRSLRDNLDLSDVVRLTGYVTDEVLHSFLVHADLCVNLRWPAMEGGSASCAEQMLFGKAIIVTDTGVYSELPDNCVRKLRPGHELEDLVSHLSDLVTDTKTRKSMGEQARLYAKGNFTPDVYARKFLAFCSELVSYEPAFGLIETAGRELRRIGATSDMAIVDTVARETALLMDGDCDPPILRK